MVEAQISSGEYRYVIQVNRMTALPPHGYTFVANVSKIETTPGGDDVTHNIPSIRDCQGMTPGEAVDKAFEAARTAVCDKD